MGSAGTVADGAAPAMRLVHTSNLRRIYGQHSDSPVEDLLNAFATVSGGTDAMHNAFHFSSGDKREDFEVTAKLFMRPKNCHTDLISAVDALRARLGTDTVDLLILSVAGPTGVSGEPEPLSNECLESLRPLWTQAMKLRQSGRVKRLGVSDFGRLQLSQLITFFNDKPDVNQVNIDQCCRVPKDLVELAQSQGIELLTHSDPVDFLPSDKLCDLFRKRGLIGEGARIDWLMRHSTLDSTRGVVVDKAWIMAVDDAPVA